MPMFLVFVDSVMAYAIYMSLFVSVLFSKLGRKGFLMELGYRNEYHFFLYTHQAHIERNQVIIMQKVTSKHFGCT